MSSIEQWRSRGAPDSPTPNLPLTAVLERLTGERRRVLAALLSEGSPMAVGDLAGRLAGDTDATEGDVEPTRASLRHAHLPALAEADLVEHDTEAGTVTTTDHPVYDDPWFRRLLETDAELDRVLDCLTHDRRRRILAALDATDGRMTREGLAAEVASKCSDETTEEVLVSLHHVHLPKLESMGLIECEGGEETVVEQTGSDVEWEWFRYLHGA